MAELETVHHALEFGHGIAGIDPAEIAALDRGRVVGIELGEFGEIGAIDNALAQVIELAFDVSLGHDLAGFCQYVPHMGLLDRGRRAAASALDELDQMESG